MRLIAIGRMGQAPEAALFTRYSDRLRPGLQLLELPEARGNPVEIKRKEAATILAALPEKSLAVALDLGGKAPASEAFAELMERWREAARPLCFIIGGAEGLDAAVIERADYVLSLGAMTWPHMLVRVLLAEQLFRAQAIVSGHPYHRAGRPQ